MRAKGRELAGVNVHDILQKAAAYAKLVGGPRQPPPVALDLALNGDGPAALPVVGAHT